MFFSRILTAVSFLAVALVHATPTPPTEDPAGLAERSFPPNIIVTRYFPSPDPDGKPRYRLQGLNFGSATAKVSANVTDFQTHQLLFKTGPITKFGPRFQIDLPLVACDSTPEDADKGRLAEMAIVDSVSGFHQEHIDIVVGCKPGGALF